MQRSIRWIGLYAATLLMIASVGRGAVTPNDAQGLSQAGHSSIYFYDVTASQTHGKGKLQINVDKGTFEFNGQGFEPSAQIGLRARMAGSAEFVVFASGRPTESGNLHISGTWQAGAAAAEVVAGQWYPPTWGFNLHNTGWFIAQIACYYSTDNGVTWHESDHSADVGITGWRAAHGDELGVPMYALMKIHVIVIGGKDRTDSKIWQYTEMGGAAYEISGTTMNPTLIEIE
jgi:hypothetical protein